MHVVLGQTEDPTCSALVAHLGALGLEARVISSPFTGNLRLALDRTGHCVASTSALSFGENCPGAVESVFVRYGAGLDPSGWEPDDLTYMQAESHAALLAWFSALDCPVVNRVSADLWYRPRNHLLHWLPMLRRCGLNIPEIVISNRQITASRFRRDLETDGIVGAICMELANATGWMVGPGDWSGIAAFQGHAPVCLAEPHGAPKCVCIVGDEVVQNDGDPALDTSMVDRLREFAMRTALDFLEVVLARVRSGLEVIDVEPFPRLEHFGQGAQAKIIPALGELLTGKRRHAIPFRQAVP